MTDETTNAFARADLAIADIVAIRRTAAHRLLLTEGTGLAGSEATMRVLRAVDDLGRATPSVSAVAARLGMEQPNVSREVERAVGLGLVAKEPAPGDGRRAVLLLTDRGRQVVAELDARRREVHGRLVEGWTLEEVEALGPLLEKLVDSYLRVLRREPDPSLER